MAWRGLKAAPRASTRWPARRRPPPPPTLTPGRPPARSRPPESPGPGGGLPDVCKLRMVGPRGGPIKGHREGHCTSRAATVLRMLAHTRPSPRPSPRWLALMPRYTTPRARRGGMSGEAQRAGDAADVLYAIAGRSGQLHAQATGLDLGVVEGLGDGVDGA